MTSATTVSHTRIRFCRGQVSAVYLVMILAFDISVFALTMAKTWWVFWHDRGLNIMQRVSRDGVLYFL